MRKLLMMLSLTVVATVGLAGCGVKDAVDKVQKSADNAQKKTQEFEARQKKAQESTYEVTYSTDSNNSSNTGFVYARDAKKNISALKSDNSLIIFDGNTKQVINCSDLDTEPQCIKSESQTDDFLSIYGAGFFGAGLAELLTVVPGVDSKEFSKTIAGRDAQCTEATPGSILGQKIGNEGDKFISCYDKDTGVALYYESISKGATDSKVEATKFSTSPDSKLFTAPVTPKSTDDIINDATSTTRRSTTTTMPDNMDGMDMSTTTTGG